jgi:uncharacterized DUF497 family protein
MTGVLKAFCDTKDMTLVPNETVRTTTCKSYVDARYVALALTQSISQIIVAVNFILRMFIIKCVQYIGLDTESGQT